MILRFSNPPRALSVCFSGSRFSSACSSRVIHTHALNIRIHQSHCIVASNLPRLTRSLTQSLNLSPIDSRTHMKHVDTQIKLTPTAAQEQAPTVWRSLVHIFKTEGLMGYFKGNGTNVIRMIPYSAVQFAAYEQYKKLLLTYPSPVDDLNTPRRLFAGAMAGITSVCATYPLDLIRTRLSAQGEGPDRKYKGIYDCLRTILREEGGARGLFRGLSPTLMGVAPYVALNFTVYESIKRWLLDQMQVKELSVPVRLLCGALAGATAQSITYPFDVIRRRMQMKGCSGPSFAYTSTLNAFTTIIRVEGVRGLYKGMVPNCLKVAPSMSISFVMYEFCKKLLFGGEVQGGRGAL
ncbi:EF-hand domain-containing protein, variant [Capsaspora owczarzaki ATCC 30864]|uniref:EF-hand domain-containing protein, variant n=1 Tax=Capsaspora owczarzaki (strain ATCC 30864) TaxID=595528 RepID=A0A0D2WK96_CAPO3|nr:EF-hand domain-containing protein, variant [Capsaspora owczarzaki ATCC 30864]